MSHHHAKKCPFCPSPSPIPSWLRGARSGPPPRPGVRAPPPRRARAHGHRRFVGHLEGQTLPDRLLPQREALHHRLSDGSRFAHGKLVTGGVTWEFPIGEGKFDEFLAVLRDSEGEVCNCVWWVVREKFDGEMRRPKSYTLQVCVSWDMSWRSNVLVWIPCEFQGGPCLSVPGWPLCVGKAPNLQKCLVGLVGSLGAHDSSFGSWNSEFHKKKITYLV